MLNGAFLIFYSLEGFDSLSTTVKMVYFTVRAIKELRLGNE